jgi:two-component system KDP operon response regulator KdpE
MSGPKILIVDDEPAIHRFLKSALLVNGYEVLQAMTGHDALTQVARGGLDLVVLDLGLPDMAGEAVLAEIRQTTGLPVIVLSASGDESGKVRLLDFGADDYVVKPFGIDELLARLRQPSGTACSGTAQHLSLSSARSRSIWCATWCAAAAPPCDSRGANSTCCAS